jgi:hypothetical protein
MTCVAGPCLWECSLCAGIYRASNFQGPKKSYAECSWEEKIPITVTCLARSRSSSLHIDCFPSEYTIGFLLSHETIYAGGLRPGAQPGHLDDLITTLTQQAGFRGPPCKLSIFVSINYVIVSFNN